MGSDDEPSPNEPGLNFEYSASARQPAVARRRMERAAVISALATFFGVMPAYLNYFLQHSDGADPSIWMQNAVQATTFAVFGGAWCGMWMGAGLSFPTTLPRRFVAALVLGGFGCAIPGAVGSTHFGSMHLPYFGGPELLASIALGVLGASSGFARTESLLFGDLQTAKPLAWWRCAACAVAPVPGVLLIVATLWLRDPNLTSLDFRTVFRLAKRLGLPLLGAIGGAIIGLIAAAWLGGSALLASHWCARLSGPHPNSRQAER